MSEADRNRLYIDNETTTEELYQFVAGRIQQPVEINGTTIFDFHNRRMDTAAVLEWAKTAKDGCYVIPYQVSGAWAIMSQMLPERLRNARLLVYQDRHGQYHAHNSWSLSDPDLDRYRTELSSLLADD